MIINAKGSKTAPVNSTASTRAWKALLWFSPARASRLTMGSTRSRRRRYACSRSRDSPCLSLRRVMKNTCHKSGCVSVFDRVSDHSGQRAACSVRGYSVFGKCLSLPKSQECNGYVASLKYVILLPHFLISSVFSIPCGCLTCCLSVFLPQIFRHVQFSSVSHLSSCCLMMPFLPPLPLFNLLFPVLPA